MDSRDDILPPPPPVLHHASLAWAGQPCTLLSVADGDTIRVQGGPLITIEDRIRLLGIDAPERNEDGWALSRELLGSLVRNREIRVEGIHAGTLTRGRCNRILAWVWVDECLVNWQMVMHGLARSAHDWGEGTHTAALDAAEAYARSRGFPQKNMGSRIKIV